MPFVWLGTFFIHFFSPPLPLLFIGGRSCGVVTLVPLQLDLIDAQRPGYGRPLEPRRPG